MRPKKRDPKNATQNARYTKYNGIWTSNPSHRVQDRSKKISFGGSGPWIISYRLSYKSPQSVNPMKSSSVTDRQTDRQSADNSVFFSKFENTLKKVYVLYLIIYFFVIYFFSFFVIFWVFLEVSVDGVELDCEYHDYYYDRCEVERADLSMKTIGTSFTFSGTQEQIQTTTQIIFKRSGRVAHLPRNLFQEFPNLNELEIYFSDIPILQNDFFKPEHNKLQELALFRDKIKIIEGNAFALLINLERISLEQNEIKSLPENLFQNNHKLIEIYLQKNKIKIIAPGSFKNLNQLTGVKLEGNECFARGFGCWNCNGELINVTVLDHLLQPCYENHDKSLNLLNKGAHKNIVKAISTFFFDRIFFSFFSVKASCSRQIKSPRSKRDTDGIGLIFGGALVRNRKYPWAGAYFHNEDFQCGGNLSKFNFYHYFYLRASIPNFFHPKMLYF
jgi:hypothetical protein